MLIIDHLAGQAMITDHLGVAKSKRIQLAREGWMRLLKHRGKYLAPLPGERSAAAALAVRRPRSSPHDNTHAPSRSTKARQ
jgi:hypothetical protein